MGLFSHQQEAPLSAVLLDVDQHPAFLQQLVCFLVAGRAAYLLDVREIHRGTSFLACPLRSQLDAQLLLDPADQRGLGHPEHRAFF